MNGFDKVRSWLGRSTETAGCGHAVTSAKGEVAALDATTVITMPRNEAGGFDFCLACVARMSIRCAWCGNVIFIGSPVTLYTPKQEFVVPDHAVVYNEDPMQLVGCLGWDCADTGGDRAGFWIPDPATGNGHVHRMMSPIEIAFSGGKGVIINDLSNPCERPTIL